MTTLMPRLQISHPRSIEDAISLRRARPDSQFVAGGTDLLVNMRHGIRQPRVLIDLSCLDEMAAIRMGNEGARIGAGVTIAQLARDSTIAARYRAVTEAAEQIAGPGHRAIGTVGGNLCLDTRCIYYNQSAWWRGANKFCLKHLGETCHVAPQGQRCHAAFTGDLAPAFLVLGTEVEIAGAVGRRRLPLSELYIEDGRRHLALANDELVVAVHLPAVTPPSAYAKVRLRGAIDYPLAGVAVALAAADGMVASLRIAVTGTNSRPFLLEGTEALYGRPVDERALQTIDRLVQKQVQPMRTTIVSAHYRRLAAAVLARRLTASLNTGARS
jgi:4-hydroxybenzoyl-CoA reductase subunit beta